MTPQEQEGYLPETEHDNGPCDPDSDCPVCASYWQRMIAEGFWDVDRREWTAKGFKEIVRNA